MRFPVLLWWMGFFWFVTAPGLGALSFWDREEPEVLADRLVQSMDGRELAAQVLMVGYTGDVPGDDTRQWCGDRGAGGIKIFGWNATSPSKVAQAVRLLQGLSRQTRFGIPLLVATDQEGGWVRHIKGTTSQSAGNLGVGSSGLPYDSWMTGYSLGLELRQMGVNMNFAPSVDLYTNPGADVIGPRSFSQNPLQAAVLAMAFCRGSLAAGVIPTAKHFPGHGNTPDDSHGKLPVLQESLETLRNRELVPYRLLVKDGLPCVMTGHLAFPQVTGNLIPASLNSGLTAKILRDELGFSGVVITDDLYMEGARPAGWGPAKLAVTALTAGNDMILISQPASTHRAFWEALVQKFEEDPGFRDRLKEAARRILLLKLKYLKGEKAVPLDPQEPELPVTKSRDFFFQQTLRSSVLWGGADLPWPERQEGVLVISPYEGFFRAIRQRFPSSWYWAYPYDFYGADARRLTQLASEAAGARKIVFHLVTPGSLRYLKVLEPYKDKLAVVTSMSPVPLRETPWVSTSLAVFGAYPDAFDAAAAVLRGDFRPRGRLPLRFGAFPPETP